jgi:hypothetical protein
MEKFIPSSANSGPSSSDPKKEAAPSLENIKTRIEQAPVSRQIRVVMENPGPGQLTQRELMSMDPEGSHDSDCASAALITAFVSPGQYSKEEFIKYLAEDEQEESVEAMTVRYHTTVNNMLEAGVLEERDGKIYSAVDFSRR